MKCRRIFGLMLMTISLYTPSNSATISFEYGIIDFSPGGDGVVLFPVEGVVALDLDNPNNLNRFINCMSDAGPSNLVWEKKNTTDPLRFNTIIISGSLRLQLSDDGAVVGEADLGAYICRDRVTEDNASITLSGGSIAVLAEESVYAGVLGGNISLRAFVAGAPAVMPGEVSWRGPSGAVISTGGRLAITNNVTFTALDIQNLNLSHRGRYTVTINRSISLSSSLELEVYVGPHLTLSPDSMTVSEFNSVTFTCAFQGRPQPSITWQREGTNSLPEMSNFATSVAENAGLFIVTRSLTIPSLQLEDQGRYRCLAANSPASSEYVNLIIQPGLRLSAVVNGMPLMINQRERLLHIPIGSRVEVNCTGAGLRSWSRSSSSEDIIPSETLSDANVFQISNRRDDQQVLVFQNFSAMDVGLYTCRSNLTINDNILQESIFITDSDPAVYIAETIKRVNPGESAVVEVEVYSSNLTSLVIQLFHEGTLINPTDDPRFSINIEERSLHIRNVDRSLLGQYQVVVGSNGISHSDTFQLVLQDSSGTPSTMIIFSTTVSSAIISPFPLSYICVILISATFGWYLPRQC